MLALSTKLSPALFTWILHGFSRRQVPLPQADVDPSGNVGADGWDDIAGDASAMDGHERL